MVRPARNTLYLPAEDIREGTVPAPKSRHGKYVKSAAPEDFDFCAEPGAEHHQEGEDCSFRNAPERGAEAQAFKQRHRSGERQDRTYDKSGHRVGDHRVLPHG